MASKPWKLVDTHCHLWDRNLAGRVSADFGPLNRSFLPADLAQAGQSVGVEAFVLIEAGATAQENAWIQRQAGQAPHIAAFVPRVDLQNTALSLQLDRWQMDPKFRGVRHPFQDEPDRDILKRPAIVEAIKELARRQVVCEFLVRVWHLADIVKICQSTTGLKAIIEHLAKPNMLDHSELKAWQQGIRALARDTDTVAKLSLSPRSEQMADLVARPGQGWPQDQIQPYVTYMLEQFGTDRLMWGSDWPIALLTTNHAGIYEAMCQSIGPIDADAKRKLFRRNAIRFYELNLEP